MGKMLNLGFVFLTFINTSYQRSRSFTYLRPRSLRFNRFKVFSKSAKKIETKLLIEFHWGLEIKVCSWDLVYLTKMA